MPTVAYLGLGANLGDPMQQLVDAKEALKNLSEIELLRCSSFYISSPVGYDAQPDFINCVVELKTHYKPLDLLDCMQTIESNLGRRRVVDNQNAPRLIDIDLLLYGDQEINNERLIVPHPRMEYRLFVLKPLLELVDMKKYRSALSEYDFDGQSLKRLIIDV